MGKSGETADKSAVNKKNTTSMKSNKNVFPMKENVPINMARLALNGGMATAVIGMNVNIKVDLVMPRAKNPIASRVIFMEATRPVIAAMQWIKNKNVM